MPESKRVNWQEVLREISGFLRPEIRKIARSIVDNLPEKVKHPIIGRFIGFLAQKVEKKDLKGFQETLSDVLEIISDEIGKQLAKPEKKEKIEELKELKKLLERIRERLQQTENIEQEKERILEELTAFKEIIQAMKEIEETFVPEEKKKEIKIDWNKIFQKIEIGYNTIKKTTTEKIIPELKKAYSELDQKANNAAQKVKKWPRPF